jgi:YesN/AraC family two-component response regulator
MNSEILRNLERITDEEQEFLNGKSEINKGIYMNSSTMTVDSKKLLESGKLIQLRKHTRFVHFPRHMHNYVEFVYMCKGKTEHILNSEKLTLRAGELLFLNQNVIQEILPAKENDIAVNFIILTEFFDQSLKMMNEEKNLIRDFIISSLKSENDKIGYLHFKVSDILPIQNLIENMIWTLMNNQPNKRYINQITMGLLILQLMNYTDKAEVGKDNLEQSIILNVFRFIEEHYKDGKLSDLASDLNYELYWLSKMVKKLTGKTFTDLVQKKRLNQVVFLLKNTNLSIENIAIAVGYDNKSYFYRLFRREFNISPNDYRKSIINSKLKF